jgi:glycosyltransferase involved in cell wall biosynthesis
VTPERRHLFLIARSIDDRGGLQRVLHTLGRGFAERGHDVELIGIYPPDGPPAPKPVDPPYRTTTISRFKEPTPWRPRSAADYADLRGWERELRRRWLHRRHVAALSQRLSRAPHGIVISGQVGPMEWISDVDTAHLRIVAMSHESYSASRENMPPPPATSRYDRIMRYFPSADAVLVLSEDDAERFRADGLAHVEVMPNPVPFWPETGAALDEPAVIAVGRLDEGKRLDVLVRAWRVVAARRPDWRLRIYGEGPQRDPLERLAGELGIGAAVTFAGPTDDVAGALANAAVFALSSDHEGSPLSVLEAMASGVPCVATDSSPGVRALIRDGVDGFVVPRGEPEAFAAALLRLVDDPELRRRFGTAARAAASGYSLPAVLERWEGLFTRLDSM